jgi:hypothetical protein
MITLRGGCQCGRHRYTVRLDRPEGYFCHCRMCQRAFGNVFATFINARVADVTWDTVEPEWYASSRIARRGFCAGCGTPLAFHYPDSTRMDLSVGSLDDPAAIQPTEQTGVEGRLHAWAFPGVLPESRLDDDAKLLERWQAAYGPGSSPGFDSAK